MIRVCEELFINANPATCVALHNGFFISYYNNQSPCTIYCMDDKKNHLSERIALNEGVLKRQGFDPSYRIVFQKDYQKLDDELLRNGYEKSTPGMVKMVEIEKLRRELFTFASFIQNGVFIEEGIKDVWLNDYAYFKNMPQDYMDCFKDNMLRSISYDIYFTLVEQNVILGIGYGIMDKGVMVINDILINPKYLNLGYGKRLLMSMLSYALREGANRAIACVETDNIPANKIFTSAGFKDQYAYWYRNRKIR